MFVLMTASRRIPIIILLTIGVGCTFSVGAYGALAVVLLVGPVFRRPAITVPYLLVLSVMALLTYMSGLYAWSEENVFYHLGGQSASDRLTVFQGGIAAMERHPFLGLGFGKTVHVLHTPIHNTYLQMIVDIGIPGGLVFIGAVAYILIRLDVLLSAEQRPSRVPWLKAALVSMIAMAIHWLAEPFYDCSVSWMCMGLASSPIVVFGRRYNPRRVTG